MRTWALLLAVCLLLGCATQRRGPRTPPGEPAAGAATRHARELREALERGTLIGPQKTLAGELLAFHEALSALPAQTPGRDSLWRHLDVLLQTAQALPSAASPPEVVADLAARHEAIRTAWAREDHEAVARLCVALEERFGPEALNPEIGTLFALSLAELGRIQEAAAIAEGILRTLKERASCFELQAALARWRLELDQPQKAAQTLQDLQARLEHETQRAALLEQRAARAVAPAQGRGAEGLEGVETLIAAGHFAGARDLLQELSARGGSPAEMEALEGALKRLEAAEEHYLQERIHRIARKEAGVEEAHRLLEQEAFEEALSKIQQLEQGQQGPLPDLQPLRELAEEGIIQRERNRAARFFLLAQKTRDRAARRKHLLSAYHILKSLDQKYPLSSLNKRIKMNMKRVEEALAALGKT